MVSSHQAVAAASSLTYRPTVERVFRQESNFAYLTGCEVAGAAFTLSYEHEGTPFDADKLQTKLYLPNVDPAEVMWCGLPPSAEDLSKTLNFTNIQTGWTSISLHPPRPSNGSLATIIHTLPGIRLPAHVASINGPTTTSSYLLDALHQTRRNKTCEHGCSATSRAVR